MAVLLQRGPGPEKLLDTAMRFEACRKLERAGFDQWHRRTQGIGKAGVHIVLERHLDDQIGNGLDRPQADFGDGSESDASCRNPAFKWPFGTGEETKCTQLEERIAAVIMVMVIAIIIPSNPGIILYCDIAAGLYRLCKTTSTAGG